jgi:hypothetical protein
LANRKERRAADRNKENDEGNNEAIEPDAVLDGDGFDATGGPLAPFPDHEEDVLFKTQMKVVNLLLGHWKTGLAVVGACLLMVLAVGQYQAAQIDNQRGFQAEIADIERRMPLETPEERFGLTSVPMAPELIANLEEGARRFETVAGSASGTGAVMAWLKAGGAWSRAGNTENEKAAYANAHGFGASDVLGWSAASQLAALQANAGEIDEALATLGSLATKVSGLEAEQTELAMAMLLEDAERAGEAEAGFQAFIRDHGNSILLEQATDGLARLAIAQ